MDVPFASGIRYLFSWKSKAPTLISLSIWIRTGIRIWSRLRNGINMNRLSLTGKRLSKSSTMPTGLPTDFLIQRQRSCMAVLYAIFCGNADHFDITVFGTRYSVHLRDRFLALQSGLWLNNSFRNRFGNPSRPAPRDKIGTISRILPEIAKTVEPKDTSWENPSGIGAVRRDRPFRIRGR